MGIDPPHRDEIEGVVVALGVRGYPRRLVPAPPQSRGWVRDGRVIRVPESPLYSVAWRGWLLVYDVFSFKYDLHLLTQVLGRYFLSLSMWFVVLNPRYQVSVVRYFDMVDASELRSGGWRVGRVFMVRFVDEDSGETYTWSEAVERGVLDLLKPVLRRVDVREFERGWLSVDTHRVRGVAYSRLRNVYNSLRYVKRQLKYGNQPEKWWLLGKLVLLANAFSFAKVENLPVPPGLKRMFRVYASEGLRGLLPYIQRRYLEGLDPEVWGFVVSYMWRRLRLLWT